MPLPAYNATFDVAPSRLNPRIPKPIRISQGDQLTGFGPGEFFGSGESETADLGVLDDSHSIHKSTLSSLLIDAKPRTPLDLIQEDFPSTPSAVYASRLLAIAEIDESGQMKMGSRSPRSTSAVPTPTGNGQHHQVHQMHNLNRPPSQNGSSIDANGLEQAMHQMYLGPEQNLTGSRVSPRLLSGNTQHQQFSNDGVQYRQQTQGQQVQYDSIGTSMSNSNGMHGFYMQKQPQQHQSNQIHGLSGQQVYIDPVYYRVNSNGQYSDMMYNNGSDALSSDQQLQMAYSQQQFNNSQILQGSGQLANGAYWSTQGNVGHLNNDPSQQMLGGLPDSMQGRRMVYPQQSGNGVGHSSIPIHSQQSGGPGIMNLHGMNPSVNPVNSAPLRPNYSQAALHSHLIHSGISVPGAGTTGLAHASKNSDNSGYPPLPMSTHEGPIAQNNLGHLSYSASIVGNSSQSDYSRDENRDNSRDNRGSNGGNRDRGGRDRNGGRERDRERDRRGNGGTGNNGGSGNTTSNGNGSGTGSCSGPRDPLVDEFRNTYGKTRQWEIRDLVSHIVAFCQDQHGSRFIQQRLEVANNAEKQLVFEEILPSALSLMTDVFGNYVIQKIFEYGAPEQCETLAALIMGQSVPLAMQMYGCRVIQKALEYVGTPRLIALVAEFVGQQVLRCVHDQNGNHVIQKCIEIVSRTAKENPDMSEYLSSRIQFIINAFQNRVKELSKHPYGCRVVQRILEHCTNQQKASVLEELRICCAELVQDQYGNYVIQHVMQHGWDEDRAILIREVQSHLLDFSQHKFASNVVEKCLQYANKRDRDEMIWGIINVTFDLNSPVDAKTGHCVLENMVRDPYANYVVQKVIDVSDERQRAAIIRYVKENIVQLRKYTYGKHIIVRLEKVSNDKF